MKTSTRDKVVSEIDSFLRRTGMSKTRFGLESVGNDKIIDQMKAGKNPRVDTIDAMRSFMAEKLAEWKARPKKRGAAYQPAA